MNRVLLSLGASGVYCGFAALGYANVTDDLATNLDAMWWGFLVAVAAGWLGTLKLIWEPL